MNENARGREIIAQILENMRRQTEELRYSKIVASSYNVHLHPDDYARLEGLVPEIVAQARRALDESLERMNRNLPLEQRVRDLVQQPRRPYERAASEWTIRILPDPNEELDPGDILVDATLVPPDIESYDGHPTQRIVPARAAAAAETERSVAVDTAASPALAVLRWYDQRGEQTFRMTRPSVKIGRGGAAYWVDVRLDTVADVSREHVRIRFDESSGTFFAQDLSSFGTTVDGVALPRTGEGDEPAESALPARAVIGLAGVVFLEFEARS